MGYMKLNELFQSNLEKIQTNIPEINKLCKELPTDEFVIIFKNKDIEGEFKYYFFCSSQERIFLEEFIETYKKVKFCSKFTPKDMLDKIMKGDYELCEHCWEPKRLAMLWCVHPNIPDEDKLGQKIICGRGEYFSDDIFAPEWCPLMEEKK